MTATTEEDLKLRYIDVDGNAHDVTASVGDTLVQVATANRVKGVDGDCGGNCACGTCLIHLEEDLAKRLASPEKEGKDLLSFLGRDAPRFRLGCQIRLTPDMSAITAVVPKV